ncbi:MAG: hypothetical protein LBJ38_00795 [Oscillospiraceae bacterium]|nr:hypothetical protein [Oscillospiraceae bacterium]
MSSLPINLSYICFAVNVPILPEEDFYKLEEPYPFDASARGDLELQELRLRR